MISTIKDFIIQYAPTLMCVGQTLLSYFFIFRKLREINVNKSVREEMQSVSKKMDVLISDNQQLREENARLLERVRRKKNDGNN